MIYTSVAEIFDSIDETRSQLINRLAGLSHAQETFRPLPDAWSVAEIIEHLSIIEYQMVQLVNMMLKKTESATVEAGHTDSAAVHPVIPFTLQDFVERSKNEKYKSPESARPKGNVLVADSLAKLKDTRAALRLLQPRLEAVDLSIARYPHPIFGPLNLYQWLAFIGLHEDRHLRQVESVIKENRGDTAES